MRRERRSEAKTFIGVGFEYGCKSAHDLPTFKLSIGVAFIPFIIIRFTYWTGAQHLNVTFVELDPDAETHISLFERTEVGRETGKGIQIGWTFRYCVGC